MCQTDSFQKFKELFHRMVESGKTVAVNVLTNYQARLAKTAALDFNEDKFGSRLNQLSGKFLEAVLAQKKVRTTGNKQMKIERIKTSLPTGMPLDLLSKISTSMTIT